MATRKKPSPIPTPAAPEPQKIGANVTNCHIENKAAPVSDSAAAALGELARASAAHAAAITSIANALKGADARMDYGIYLSNIRADNATD